MIEQDGWETIYPEFDNARTRYQYTHKERDKYSQLPELILSLVMGAGLGVAAGLLLSYAFALV